MQLRAYLLQRIGPIRPEPPRTSAQLDSPAPTLTMYFTQFSGWTSANRVGRVAFVSPHPESPGWPTEGARMYQPTTDQIRDRRANLRRPAKRAAGKRQWRAEAAKEVSF